MTHLNVPDAPALALVSAGSGQVQLRITAPSNDGGTPVSSYTIVDGSHAIAQTATSVQRFGSIPGSLAVAEGDLGAAPASDDVHQPGQLLLAQDVSRLVENRGCAPALDADEGHVRIRLADQGHAVAEQRRSQGHIPPAVGAALIHGAIIVTARRSARIGP